MISIVILNTVLTQTTYFNSMINRVKCATLFPLASLCAMLGKEKWVWLYCSTLDGPFPL